MSDLDSLLDRKTRRIRELEAEAERLREQANERISLHLREANQAEDEASKNWHLSVADELRFLFGETEAE